MEAKVLVVSDGVAAGEREDTSGRSLREWLTSADFDVTVYRVVPDGADSVAAAVREMCEDFAGLVVTSGGTGFGPRDLTPEGTLAVLDRVAPGIAEATRAISPKGRLSRAVAGTLGRALVINLPGSPGGAVECLEAVLDVVPHALALLAGEPTSH